MSLFSPVIQRIRAGRSFLVTTHANPDGDALGSALALGLGLKRLKKRVQVYNADPVPTSLKFLPGSRGVTQVLSAEARFDVTFLVDCADLNRVGETFEGHAGRGTLIVLDHHALSGRAGDINVIDPDAASSGTVVLKLLKQLRVPITKDIALNIYCTLVTDTGNFRYSNTDSSVLTLASDLLRKGVQPWEVSRNLYESFPRERLTLLARVLGTLELKEGGRVASIELTQQMLRESGASPDLAEEFINYPRSIDSVEVAIQFREAEGAKVKVSFRSKDRVDVARLAGRFGGGGHKRAAGCLLEGSLAEVKVRVFEAVSAVL